MVLVALCICHGDELFRHIQSGLRTHTAEDAYQGRFEVHYKTPENMFISMFLCEKLSFRVNQWALPVRDDNDINKSNVFHCFTAIANGPGDAGWCRSGDTIVL